MVVVNKLHFKLNLSLILSDGDVIFRSVRDSAEVVLEAAVEGVVHMLVAGLFITHTGCGLSNAQILSTIVISTSKTHGSKVILKMMKSKMYLYYCNE